jgi:hypothetical protein
MRKFRKQVVADQKTFEPILHIYLTENGKGRKIFSGPLMVGRYTAEQQATINVINKVLTDQDLPIMSQEEADFAAEIHPTQKLREDPSEEELQQLAGFKVTKTVTPTTTASEGFIKLVGTLPITPSME